ncbi:MAG: LysM peptidoglycan-binding domain-containing protein [Nitriliruptoraceae bacterium]
MMGRRGILVAWCAMLVVVTFGLHALGEGVLAAPPLEPLRWAGWMAERDPLIATFAALRVAVLAMCWYLVAVTGIGVLMRWFRVERVVAVLDRVTVPVVRRLVQQAAGVSMATVMAMAPTSALATAPPTAAGSPGASAWTEIPIALDPALGTAAPDAPPAGEEPVLPWEVAAAGWRGAIADEDASSASASPLRATEAIHLVRPGDSLWRIAREHLAVALGRVPSDSEVVPLWQRLIDVNRDRLVDPHDPDLILPGQELLVPSAVAP